MTDLLEVAKRTLAEIAGNPDDPMSTVASVPFDLDAPDFARARSVLHRTGVRKFLLHGEVTIGIWSDLDSPEIRAALRVLESDRLPVRYLDGAGVPMQFKLRAVEGEAVPSPVLTEMERHPMDPWVIRDWMLKEMGWCGNGIASSAEWKAAMLNRLFKERGTTGQPGGITAETVLHGKMQKSGISGPKVESVSRSRKGINLSASRAGSWRRRPGVS